MSDQQKTQKLISRLLSVANSEMQTTVSPEEARLILDQLQAQSVYIQQLESKVFTNAEDH